MTNETTAQLRTVVTDSLISMIAAVTGTVPPADTPPPPFIQGPIDRAMERISAAIAQQAAPVAVPPAQQPVAVKSHGAWDGLELLAEQPDGTELYAAQPAQQSPLYTCIGKGGRYEKVGSAKPAGIANFEHNIGAVIVYRDIESDHLYFRLPLDFNRRMKRIDDGDTAAPEPCPVCQGDCSSANPPMVSCPMRKGGDA